MDQVKIFAPASVANVSCGFDVLGFCLEPVGDEMVIRKTESSGLKITKIVGQSLPLDVKKCCWLSRGSHAQSPSAKSRV